MSEADNVNLGEKGNLGGKVFWVTVKTIFKDPEVENNFEDSRNLKRLAYLEYNCWDR